MPPTDTARLERFPAFAWLVIAVVVLSVVYAVMNVVFVRPYLWPAGTGATFVGDTSTDLPLKARPPDVRTVLSRSNIVTDVVRGGTAWAAGVREGDRLAWIEGPGRSFEHYVDFEPEELGPLVAWRDRYWKGVSGSVAWHLESNGSTRAVTLARPPVWRASTEGWARRHLGMIIQTVVFVGAALILLLMRSYDLTAGLCVLALAFSGVGGGGPLFGAERSIPLLGRVLTVFSWVASPLAFPTIALAMLYFPSRSRLLDRYPWLHAVPLVAAVPLIVPALGTAAFLVGMSGPPAALSVWDATHPGVFFGAFAFALSLNVLAVFEGAYRYRFNHNANERRRVRMALYTALPGVLAYAVRDGIPIVASLAGAAAPRFPTPLLALLDAMVLLPAFGLVYAVG